MITTASPLLDIHGARPHPNASDLGKRPAKTTIFWVTTPMKMDVSPLRDTLGASPCRNACDCGNWNVLLILRPQINRFSDRMRMSMDVWDRRVTPGVNLPRNVRGDGRIRVNLMNLSTVTMLIF